MTKSDIYWECFTNAISKIRNWKREQRIPLNQPIDKQQIIYKELSDDILNSVYTDDNLDILCSTLKLKEVEIIIGDNISKTHKWNGFEEYKKNYKER